MVGALIKPFLKKLLLLAGGILSRVVPLRDGGRYYFFFPYYHVGGAEQVHAEIVSVAAAERPLVVFLNHSNSDHLLASFTACGRVLRAAGYLDSLLLKTLLFGYLAATINRREHPVVFGSNSHHFYELLPLLGDHVLRIDLIHALGSGIEEASLAYLPWLDRRILGNRRSRDQLLELYRRNGIDLRLETRLQVVENAVEVPDTLPDRACSGVLKVLFVGRCSAEKRPELVVAIAEACLAKSLPVEFTLVGESFASRGLHCPPNCHQLGEIGDPLQLAGVYATNDVLILTSKREGFPLVIMEAMARGVVPICTDVGGIACHIEQGVNGFLIADRDDAGEIVRSFVERLAMLAAERERLPELGRTAHAYAVDHFSRAPFRESYRRLLQMDAGADRAGTAHAGQMS